MASFGTLFLDLDDTLYPKRAGIWNLIRRRIDAYMTVRLGLPAQEGRRLRARYYREHGTTLAGLQADFDIDPLDYLAFVHDVPVEAHLRPDPRLRRMLRALKLQRIVFTNASPDHAHRVLHALGIEKDIDAIVDVIALEYQNKPLPQAYLRAMELAGVSEPEACILVDDRVQNLVPAQSMGMKTVLVGQGVGRDGRHLSIGRVTDLPRVLPSLFAQEGDW